MKCDEQKGQAQHKVIFSDFLQATCNQTSQKKEQSQYLLFSYFSHLACCLPVPLIRLACNQNTMSTKICD